MSDNKGIKAALVGNPNAGKTSLFNQLTGLKQRVGNFPGVTVDKKSGSFKLPDGNWATVIDLPGAYSIYPRSMDERVVFDVLSDRKSADYPDVVIVIVDAASLARNLLLFTQVKDLGIPTLMALNRIEEAEEEGKKVDIEQLAAAFATEVVAINARSGQGIDLLKQALTIEPNRASDLFFDPHSLCPQVIEGLKHKFSISNDYLAYQYAQQTHSGQAQQKYIAELKANHNFRDRQFQAKETVERYDKIRAKLQGVVSEKDNITSETQSDKIDRILTHKIWGYGIFLAILFLMFQSIFEWAGPFMDLIDEGFASLSHWAAGFLPGGLLSDLLVQGVIPGLGGVLIFIPQIALLFCFIAILEESGYMARVVFLMDKLMRRFGLHGKSVVPLISGAACAIPAIMAARNIESWKERLITVFVTPLTSCSARLPVYAILIALVIPEKKVLGLWNIQGLVLMALYMFGFAAAMLSALGMRVLLKTKDRSYLMMELPAYRLPKWENVWYTIFEKSRTFVFEAGKIILAISIILWLLASYGPGEPFEQAEQMVKQEMAAKQMPEAEFEQQLSAYKLEHSYAGIVGKAIEPAIQPLGYDWKIGIALITSFAAREVFVGTIATIYSVGADGEDEATIKGRLAAELNPITGSPMYTLALGVSLLVFYAFAMQCMSTLAVVYRETKSWTWPLLQLLYMSGLAYVCAWLAYQLLK